MTDQIVIGVDVGTTGTKSILFNIHGKPIASAYREYTCDYRPGGFVEQNAEELLNAVFETLQEALFISGEAPETVLSIAIAAQRTTVIFLDEHEKPLKMIGWQDTRAEDQTQFIKAHTGEKEFYKLDGLPLNAQWILPKLLWTMENDPDIWQKTRRVAHLQDYVLRKLGADDYYMDEGVGGCTGVWDVRNIDFSGELLEAYKLERNFFSKPLPSGTPIAKLSAQASMRCGLNAGTLLCVGGGDQNCATVGAGVIAPGQLSVSLGTGGISIACTDKPFNDPMCKTMVANHAIHGKWEVEGLQNAAAGVFRWLRDEIMALEKSEAAKQGQDVYVRLNSMIQAIPSGAKGLILLPYFSGSAVPQWENAARGTLLGLSFAHDRACLARAFMEGIVFEQKGILDFFRLHGVPVSDVRIMGGATKSDIWNQIQADMYGLPVKTLKVSDAASLGAAICAAVGAGLFRDIPHAVKHMVHIDNVYFPDSPTSKLYDEMFSIYSKAYNALSNAKVFESIAALQK